jgi:hypothetical protein
VGGGAERGGPTWGIIGGESEQRRPVVKSLHGRWWGSKGGGGSLGRKIFFGARAPLWARGGNRVWIRILEIRRGPLYIG